MNHGNCRGTKIDQPQQSMAGSSVSRYSVDRRCIQQLVFIAVALVLVPSVLFSTNHSRLSAGIQSLESLTPTSLSVVPPRSVQLIPTLENVNGTEFVWQLPSDRKPKGVLFIAHGCDCRSTFFWDRHSQCESCIGLPEERALVLEALSREYAVIAISSTDDCWHASTGSVDTVKVKHTLKSWIKAKNLEGLPVSALGASSGGYFVSVLALQFGFQSLVIMISEGTFEVMDFGSDYPPTLFVHMPKDERRAAGVKRAMELLRSKGIKTAEILCLEVKVTPHFFCERITGLDEKISEKIVNVLHQFHTLNETGYMRRDGRKPSWKLPLRKRNIIPWNSRVNWEHHLEEEMNMAYAWHEMTSLQSKAIYDWFDAHSVSSVGVI